MEWASFREPISALTHGLWMLICIPAGVYLQFRAGRCPRKHFGLGLYTLSLVFCFFGSCLYHSVQIAPESIDWYMRLDYIGIFLLIAGTVTPIALVVLRGWYRISLLLMIWTMAAVGISLRGLAIPLPDRLSTGLYIMMGWAGVVCYVELSRRLSRHQLRPLVIGGILYSLGAIINSLHWPILWPGVIGYHELFHLLVMTASGFHFLFMLRVVAPFKGTATAPNPRFVPIRATA